MQTQIDSTTLAPGQSTKAVVQFSMHEGMGGQHLFTFGLRTNDPAQPLRKFSIRANIV